MKERPILMNAAMVRATLDGSKTQTRQILKQATGPSLSVDCEDGVASLSWLSGDGPGYPVEETVRSVSCPYGVPGDRLWVRESFWGCDMPGYGDQPCVVYEDEWHGKEYRAAQVRPYARRFGHIPGIHMPRDASRILLEVTGVRVERVQAITEGDAMAEGVECDTEPCDHARQSCEDIGCLGKTHKASFCNLWCDLNGIPAWTNNPWVWVVDFKRIEVKK